jgi:uncharacterized protein YqhQ
MNAKKSINNSKELPEFPILKASSSEIGIRFFSNECDFFQVFSYVDKDGKIQTDALPVYIGDRQEFWEFYENYDEKKHRNLLAGLVIIGVILTILLTAIFKSVDITFAMVYFTIFVIPVFVSTVFNYYDIDLKKLKITPKPLAKFHGAEHKVINAYNKFNRVPTFDEVKKASRYSSSCTFMNQIALLVAIFIIFLSNLFIARINLKIHIVFIVIAVIIAGLYKKLNFLKYFEFLVTSEPDDIQINCAIKGVEAFVEFEKETVTINDEKEKAGFTKIIHDPDDLDNLDS